MEPAIVDHPMEDAGHRPPKRFKTSDLPLPAGTRAAIDGLVLITKKKGEFDSLRKRVWASFADSVRMPFLTLFSNAGKMALGMCD